MRSILFIFLILNFVSQVNAQSQNKDSDNKCRIEKTEKGDCEEGVIHNITTTFPASSPAGDYNVKGYQVKLAFPLDDATSRIWVKGNEQLVFAQIFSTESKSLSEIILLEAPFFTAVISVASEYKQVNVKFAANKADLSNSENTLIAYPKSSTFLNKEDDQFSMLFYGCFQPFRINPDTLLGEVLHEKDTLNYTIRQMFTAVAEEREFQHVPYEQNQIITKKLLNNPKVVIGGGDQIYTDAGYGELDFKNHPLSAWAHKCSDPYPLLDTLEYAKHLNRCYLHFNSFDCFEKVYAKLPAINTWDDHEIRDGWGSHGDEYNDDGSINEKLKPYYLLSREAFVNHQYALGPNKVDQKTVASNQSLAQVTKVNGVDLFLFDLRSNRSNCKEIVISEEQMKTFKDWCATLEANKEVIIVSSIPFFYMSSKVVTALAEDIYEGEIRDDIIDSWASSANSAQRDTIVNELIKLRSRNIKPIILSGDVHIGALITAWYKNPKTGNFEKLCYEMISSGLSHEKLGEARSGIAASLKKRSRKIKNDKSAFSVNEVSIFPSFDFTRGRLNFGALEFTKDEHTTASLFIIGDEEAKVTERELTLNWEETFSTFRKKGFKPICWYFIPWRWFDRKLPEVPFNTVEIVSLLKK